MMDDLSTSHCQNQQCLRQSAGDRKGAKRLLSVAFYSKGLTGFSKISELVHERVPWMVTGD